ncbi:Na+/H+ ANTIPORTER [Encephalitozoon cuniculi GB-M1]|uniref:Na+/H+ ANTIPORTER n=2 Tax=Encephalitozoon cuniculi TaxID=6035 RepID=Q8SS13_ENCCU|nr:Nha1p-like protein [Encephalitozoon cuniculi GB-M1]AGE95231.1 na+/h+ antiporter [Encephalitozoon cuniculi]KMV66352.1 Na+/H+ antiporter [Encephalitozoon cuniculi EcunIII-L]UYI27534.1 Na+/H+ antiporter [Encephalitozoon cuniculi]CAD25336.1 Na+/H+ ANTIPORTER [Encephalitozoon cuniculi GB-M1]
MDDVFKLLLASSSFVLLFGLASKYIKDSLLLSEPLVSVLTGIVLGHHVLNVFDTNYVYSKIMMYNFSRVVLCIQTMTVAMSLPKNYVLEKWQSIFVLVGMVGIIKCFFSFCLVYLFTNYNKATSWSLASCLTPTDPILSSSIIHGKLAMKMVPERIRMLLAAESGINDGMGIFLLFLGLDLLRHGLRKGMYPFFIDNLLIRVFVSALIGLVIGILSRQGLKYCYTKRLAGVESFLIHGVILTVFSMALMEFMGGSELICIFFAGIVFSFDEWFVLETKNSRLQEITDTILSTSFFLFFGSRIDFSRFTLSNVIISLTIIFIRRPAICYLMYPHIPELRSFKEALFIGWFGPIGVGALYYALLTDKIQETLTIDFVSCTVFLSVLIHGLTVPMYTYMKRERLESSYEGQAHSEAF